MLTCIHVNMALYGRIDATLFKTGWCFELCSRVLRDLRLSIEQHPIGRFSDLHDRLKLLLLERVHLMPHLHQA